MPDPPPLERPAAGRRYEVPVEGSLALLALGARGLEAWRAKKAEVAQQTPSTSADAPAPHDTSDE